MKTDSNCDFGRAIQKGTKCYTTSNFTKNIDNGLKKSSANTKYSGKNAKNHKLWMLPLLISLFIYLFSIFEHILITINSVSCIRMNKPT